MKQLVLSGIFLFSVLAGLQAQLTLDRNPVDSLFTNVDLEDPYAELIIETHIINETGADVTLEWEKFIVDVPEPDTTWQAAVCIGILCYPFETSVSPEPFVAKNGEETLVSVHLRPMGLAGCGKVEVSITDEMTGNEVLRPEYTFKVNVNPDCSPLTSVREVKKQWVKLYPNPTPDHFSLSSTEGIQQLVVYNILGRPVRTFEAANQQFSLAGLPDGTYLVQFLGSRGEVLATRRIAKRRP